MQRCRSKISEVVTDFGEQNNIDEEGLASPQKFGQQYRQSSEVVTSNKKEPFTYENPKYDAVCNEFDLIEIEKQKQKELEAILNHSDSIEI